MLEYGIRGAIAIQIKMPNAKDFQRMFAYDFDLCQMLSQITKGSIISVWYRKLLKSGNIMENCPIAKGHYYAHNISLNPATLPAFLRSGDYQISSLNYYGKRKTKSYQQVVRFAIGFKIY
ncbi:uncharacterized protein LOC133327268 [Musca vetustissima]|uniref:uncharacterized protein LOC133327268 n=1 Tax=Musca vetustissima TaxID=27455 RepID=UPI002AB75B0B|nr:uncharacterized protein LOC133327268 [Musca vetustissima]